MPRIDLTMVQLPDLARGEPRTETQMLCEVPRRRDAAALAHAGGGDAGAAARTRRRDAAARAWRLDL
ncbi:hypothetical protein EJB05_42568 [Eragrostis curvula]|uniref:Uncharacterized protein n=1 Tax=Eragrostis curvula TaxID=38414 RepID=A0A5J9TD24_9POAL|nr:hypothetical protein EJB05_42568 [Eragrostis curvula]